MAPVAYRAYHNERGVGQGICAVPFIPICKNRENPGFVSAKCFIIDRQAGPQPPSTQFLEIECRVQQIIGEAAVIFVSI